MSTPITRRSLQPDARLVSHYNNQYDAVAGFASQFLRTGDVRWWELMDDLARHVVDIDIYHTDRDKSAYNDGLFWHTSHYVDAGLSTHRSYPQSPRVGGGGPSNEHNYATGLAAAPLPDRRAADPRRRARARAVGGHHGRRTPDGVPVGRTERDGARQSNELPRLPRTGSRRRTTRSAPSSTGTSSPAIRCS